MTPSMFPAIFIFTILLMSVIYLAAARFFRREEKKEDLFKENVQDWKNLYRKMGPAETLSFCEKRAVYNRAFHICSDAEEEALRQIREEWFPETKERRRE